MKFHTYTTTTIDTEHGEFELDGRLISDDGYQIATDGNLAVVAYLVPDERPPNPLEESDSYGHIYSSHRDRREDYEPMQEALGLNSSWSPDIDRFEDQAWQIVIERALKGIVATKYPKVANITVNHDTTDFSEGTVFLYYRNTRKTFPYATYHQPISGTWQCVLKFQGTEMYLDDWEGVALELWHEARKNGTVGDLYAVSLDVYDHGSVAYSVMGTSVHSHDLWDTARGGAVWVPNDYLRKDDIETLPVDARRGRCIELAGKAADVYTDWSNGWVYGITIELFTRESEDDPWERIEDGDIEDGDINEYESSCFGFYGWDYTLQEAKDMAENGLKYLKERK